MNRTILAALLGLVLALVSACDAAENDLPTLGHTDAPKASGAPLNPEVEAPAFSAAGTEIARQLWGDMLGVELPPVPQINWYGYLPDEPPCLHYPGNPYDGCTYGTFAAGYMGRGEIDVLTVGFVSYSGLPHEMLHWALWVAEGSANGAHDHPLFDELQTVSDAMMAEEIKTYE